MRYTTLVSIGDLAAHLNDPDWIVCDCRHDLVKTDLGRGAYAQAHIPGARFVHLDEDLSAPLTGRNGRHPLPDPAKFVARLGALGIDDGKQVVAYDASGGTYAARLWCMLRWVGHEASAVLDGGWDAWSKAGQPVTGEPPTVTAARFVPRHRPEFMLDAAAVAAAQGNPRPLLIDARSADRFRGENETLDPVGGHIPGALNRFFRLNLDAEGRFKPVATLRAEFEAALGEVASSDIVHYCGSGVSACHNLLAMEIAGLGGSRLYPGSWSEWIADRSRPVATGSAK
jgi:thiosulfate/3-mercaptopyruvate sulfurtransferase